jgi:hypothetical protein
MVFKELDTLMVCSTHWNQHRCTSQYMYRNQCLLWYGRVCYWVSISGERLKGPALLTNKLTGAVNHCSFWRMNYQYSSSTDNITRGSRTMWHCQTLPEPDFKWTADRTRRLCQLVCTISWPYSTLFFVVGTPNDFGRMTAAQWLASWKLCLNEWEPHRASVAEITRTSPISEQALDICSGHMLTAKFCSFKSALYPLEHVTLNLNLNLEAFSWENNVQKDLKEVVWKCGMDPSGTR